MTIKLTFYTTDGCHLCEDAKALLQQLLAARPDYFQIDMVDIVDSNQLVEKYGTRIPVVLNEKKDSDLGWPFGYSDLLNYANQ
ncbi:MAG: glutaredoxin family protein [Cycloclasticus sp.]